MHGLKKLWRDLWLGRGRTLTIVLAIAVGLTGFNATLGAYGILTREMQRSYLESAPASATLELSSVSDDLLRAAEGRPEVLAATRRKTIHGRYRAHTEAPWRRALVFVVDEFDDMRVAKVFKERGAWPPPDGTVLLERSGLARLKADIGGSFWLALPGRPARQVRISGIAHEPALAPAQTEQAVYVYVSAETARLLGESPLFDELRVLVRDQPNDRRVIEERAEQLAAWISQRKLGEVHGIRVPPPGKHPHQTQMTAILVLLLAFSGFSLLMSCFLAASLVSSMMARQVREIGIMKALGARTRLLALLYGLLTMALATFAIVVSWFPGELGARRFSASVAKLLNFDIESYHEPTWLIVVKLGVGLLVPGLALLPSVWRGCTVSVRAAFDEHGANPRAFGQRRLEAWLSSFQAVRAPTMYSLRNVLRQRRQLALSLALLSAAGGTTVTAMSVAKAWDALTEQLVNTRHYEFEVRFSGPVVMQPLVERMRALAGVGAVETWRSVPTALGRRGHIAIENTYPDDSHGALHLVAPPDAARMLDVEVHEGRWLRPSDRGVVVVNQMVPGHDRLRLGDTLTLSVRGQNQELLVVGKILQVGVSGTAYVNARTFDSIVPTGERGGMLWLRSRPGANQAASELEQDLERELERASAPVQSVLPLSVFQNAMVAHFELLVKTLLGLAALTALVGALGLGSSMSINVVGRTRELGVLRALGASKAHVRQSVLLEGVLVGVVSLVGAVLLGMLLALVLGSVIGRLSFGIPLPLTLSWTAVGAWGVLALTLTLLATWVPASRAAQTSVSEALAFV